MNKYTVMPLLNSSFEPGKAREIVAGFEDMDVRNIAQAELFYFMGEAESSSEIAERYLTSEIMELRLSASMIYGYSNMTLGNLVAVQRGLEEIQECLKLAMRKKVSEETLAVCVFARYAGAVLLHLPTDGIPSLWKYSSKLPEGVRLFAVYVMAHHSYLNGEYWSVPGSTGYDPGSVSCKYDLYSVYAGNVQYQQKMYRGCTGRVDERMESG